MSAANGPSDQIADGPNGDTRPVVDCGKGRYQVREEMVQALADGNEDAPRC